MLNRLKNEKKVTICFAPLEYVVVCYGKSLHVYKFQKYDTTSFTLLPCKIVREIEKSTVGMLC